MMNKYKKIKCKKKVNWDLIIFTTSLLSFIISLIVGIIVDIVIAILPLAVSLIFAIASIGSHIDDM